ncbi:MAG: CCA tRNA nucleotidyltransferase [bacterium]
MIKLPKYIINIVVKLQKAGYEAYIVGGCVRDWLLKKEPEDWDITTNAKPEEILKVFSNAKYENAFGTVLVKVKNSKNQTETVVEVTTYRSEQGYSDRRHPDNVKFEDSLEKDLARRDFTINALAMDLDGKITDLYGGEDDLKKKIIRSVGEPADRFKEDALRMMRAIRFVSQLGFEIEPKTERAIVKLAGSIKFVANERVRDELIKIIASDRPYEGVIKMQKTKLLNYILPELEDGVGVKQNYHHIYTVFDHNTLSLKHCPSKDWRVRFAALLHDIAKPKTLKYIDNKNTFYNHEYVGEKMARKIMKRLKFANDDLEKVAVLVRNHMFYYNVDEVSASSVRRLILKVGEENLKALIDMRVADRLGSGTPKAIPYKLRHLQYMMDKVRHDPISVKMLKINGDEIMELLKIKPGPKIGAILDVLLSDVIEDPKLNTEKHLKQKSQELADMNLNQLRNKAKHLIEETRESEDQELKKTHRVK